MKLADKVAVVTGGGRGIGRAIARRFGKEGAQVVIAQRDPESAARTIGDIEAEGGKASFVQTDVGEPKQITAMVRTVDERYDRLDILVNNAAVTTGFVETVLDMPLETWQRVININLTGVFLCSQAAARLMVAKQIPGYIIHIASINSYRAQAHAAHYITAKGALISLTQAMAIDLAPYGIVVNSIAPGLISTERTRPRLQNENYRAMVKRTIPMGRTGEADEVAALAVFLSSGECRYIQGETIVIDGGLLSLLRLD